MKVVSTQLHLRVEFSPYLPFLYYTRTILRGPPHFKRATGQATFSTTTRLSRNQDGVTDYEVLRYQLNAPEKRVTFLKAKLEAKADREAQMERMIRPSPRPTAAKTSTITGKEQRVFKNIFKDIATGSASTDSGASITPEQKPKSPIDYREIFSVFSNAGFQEVPVNSKKRAATGASGGQQDVLANEKQLPSPTLTEQDQEYIQKYPERLRKIASRATLLAKIEPLEEAPDGSRHNQSGLQGQRQLDGSTRMPQTDLVAAESEFSEASAVQRRAIDSICVEQMKNISEALMEAATANDRELWIACETSVFPMLEFLGEDPSRSASVPTETPPPKVVAATPHEGQHGSSSGLQTSSQNPKAGRRKRILQEAEPNHDPPKPKPPPPFGIPVSIPPLPIISTLYPALLLLTLRLLTTHYPLSPYPQNLLPRIRSLGLRSYVLGTSTQLYNTLLAHRWHAYSDLRGMDSILNEMERGGVGFDVETVDILERVRADKVADEVAEANASMEAKAELAAMMMRKDKKKASRKRLEEKGRNRGSAGKRSSSWWQGEVTRGWLERVVGKWRVKVMETVRQRGASAGREAVVEREYASSVGGKGEEHEAGHGKEVAVWL